MTPDFSKKTAIVTGASRGIGLAIAKRLAQEGVRLILVARNRERLEVITNEIPKVPSGPHLALDVDLRDPESEMIVGNAIQALGKPLDFLINNAGGITKKGKFEELSDSDWIDALELNLLSAVRMTRASLPALRKSEIGRILMVSSIVARQPGTHNPHYSAAKMALLNLSKHLSISLAPDGILVNTLIPGMVETEGWDEYIHEKAKVEGKTAAEVRSQETARAVSSIPIGKMGTPDQIAEVALFLLSKKAELVTGAEWVVDGGKLRGL